MNLDINKLKNSKDLALFLGMFAGDGCLSISHNGEGYRIYPLRFYNTNKKLVELFSDLFFKLFGLRGKIRGRKRENKQILWGFEKYSIRLYKIVNVDFEIPCGKKALKVGIPTFILKGDKEVKKHFFLGLLVTDGSIRKSGDIMFHLASHRLIYDLKALIKDIWGINRQVRTYLQRGKFNSYQLTLNKSESSLVLPQLPTWHNLVLRGSGFRTMSVSLEC